MGRAIGIRGGAVQFGADRPVNGPAMSARSAAILNAIGSATGALKRVSSSRRVRHARIGRRLALGHGLLHVFDDGYIVTPTFR